MTITLPVSSDRDVLTIPQAADLANVDRHTFTDWLRDEAFYSAVVIDVPGKRTRISRPRLLRRLHGEAIAS